MNTYQILLRGVTNNYRACYAGCINNLAVRL
jgi:hypothetical protein